jgi:hypothetical protein
MLVNLHWYWKDISICLCIKKTIHRNHKPRLKELGRRCKTTLENRKKATTYSPRSVFKKKNKIEEGRASGLRMKREQESIDLRP